MNVSVRKKPLHVWGMANATLGLVGGYIYVPMAQQLVARGLPQDRVDGIVANCLLPGFWAFALAPLVDVRFSRRAYAVFFNLLAGAAMTAALLSDSVLAIETLLTISYASAIMSSNAVGGWLATLIDSRDDAAMSSWTQIAAFIGYGLSAALPAELGHFMPMRAVAVAMGLLVASPTIACAFIPMPAEEIAMAKRLAESFGTFGRELLVLIRRREVLLALPLFLAPLSAFALTNNLAGMGKDFHASDLFVSRVSGPLLTVAGVAGCALVPLVAKKLRVLQMYFVIGIVGAVFTLVLVMLVRTPATFALAVMGENIFQAMGYTAAVAIVFESIGPDNPLAGTQFGLLTAATVLPINYMGRLDGWAYAHKGGVRGELLTDALVSLTACLVLLPMLRFFRKTVGPGVPPRSL